VHNIKRYERKTGNSKHRYEETLDESTVCRLGSHVFSLRRDRQLPKWKFWIPISTGRLQ